MIDTAEFNFGSARSSDPSTSHLAALSINASALEKACLWSLGKSPKTTEEVAEDTGYSLQSITPRMAPLRSRGMVADTGLRRAGASGRKRIVWRVA